MAAYPCSGEINKMSDSNAVLAAIQVHFAEQNPQGGHLR